MEDIKNQISQIKIFSEIAQIPFKDTSFEQEIQSKLKETLNIYGKRIESNSSVQVDIHFLKFISLGIFGRNSKDFTKEILSQGLDSILVILKR